MQSKHSGQQSFLLDKINTNLSALGLGYLVGRLGKLGEPASRSLAIETGIQNSGLGLIICFNFFPEIGEMALLCASWGIWHIISGMTLSAVWSRNGASDPAI